MRAQPVDLIGGYYADDTLPWSSQDTVNWLPVMAEVAGTRTPKYLKTPPGLKPYQNIGTGPIRGMHDLEGARFIVSGRYLFRISNTGVGIPIGIIPGVGRVSMTHNQFKTGYQLLVENGQGGGGYVYDSTTQTFGRITDPGYPGSISSDYLDSYMLGVEPQGRFWFHSNLADATDYNTLDRYEAEASPDKIVGLAVSQFEVVVFGQRTTEFFYNVGTATGTFQNRRQAITRGCASRHSIAKLDNTLFWLGDDGIVYRLNGYAALPVSTGPMHRAFAGLNWAEAFAYVWEDRGFKVYYLTFPDGYTWAYDVVSGLWTRSQSFGLKRRRLTHTVKWGSQWFGGDFQDGRLWELDWDYLLEGDEEFISERTSPVLHDNQSSVGIPNAELIFDTGQGPMTEAIPFPVQPSAPTLTGDAPGGNPSSAWGPYSYVAAGGSAPYTFTLVSGSLPPGIGPLSSSGVIAAGTPTGRGLYSFRIRVTDANGLWAELSDSISIIYPVLAMAYVSNQRRAFRSNDGITWDLTPINAADSNNTAAQLVADDQGRLFGFSLANVARPNYSADYGVTWPRTTQTMTIRGLGTYLDGRFFVGNNQTGSLGVYASSDGGANFVVVNAVYQPTDVCALKLGSKVAIGETSGGTTSQITTDAFLTVTNTQAHGINGGLSKRLASDGESFYIYGASATAVPRAVRISTAGTVTVLPLPAVPAGSRYVSAMAFSPSVKVAAIELGRMMYDDGSGFKLSATQLDVTASYVLWTGANFVAGGSTASTGPGSVWYSADGKVWTKSNYVGTGLTSLVQRRSV